PLLEGLTTLGKRFTPQGYLEGVRTKLVIAGTGDQDSFDRFMAIRVVTVVLAPIAAYLAYTNSPVSGMGQLLFTLLAGAICVVGPDSVLDRKVQDRQFEIRRKLPDVMDLLVISVEAGLGF